MRTQNDPCNLVDTLGQQFHVCAFFNGIEEQYSVLRSYIAAGFDSGEKAFHLVDPELRDEHLKRLGEVGVDVEAALASGQLEVRLWQDSYLRDGQFDQDAMLAWLREQFESIVAAGFQRARLIAHMEWWLLDELVGDSLFEYEARINLMMPRYGNAAICTYELPKLKASMMIDLLRTHPLVIIGGLLQSNPFFVPPEQFLREIRERRSVSDAAGGVD
ncbi:MEDS domain-containing protein [Dactylosporangium sp. NPDC051484]|uniref:MEDS domain-containing protein n=1 Tax=Dactylosporangium sp. NPDC051484 TaxID=3154942 RepID=UPI00344B3C6B